MPARFTQQAEEEQSRRLGWVQERLTAAGIRSLLIRRIRLTLTQNRYDPPEPDPAVLVAGPARILVENGYHVQLADGASAHFEEVDATAAYVSAAAS